MKYNKKEIMKTAWSIFRQEIWTSDLEYVSIFEESRQATFAECLKEAWGREKEYQQNKVKEVKYAETSEEVKAWDWACRKLNVQFDLPAVKKMRFVDEMQKEAWPGTSVWSLAMRAVKLHIKIGA
ncbi:anti-CRISPR protein AcrIIA3 [Streptococcus suis]